MSLQSNRNILLAVLPGLLATAGLVSGDTTPWMVLGCTLLLLFVAAAWLQNNRQLPDWSLMAVGMLLGVIQPIILVVFGVFVALITHTPPSPVSSPFLLALPWVGIAVVAFFLNRSTPITPKIWLLMAAIVACSILVRLKYFVLFGTSWSVLGQVLGISLWSAGTLLLPIMAVGLLARCYGVPAVLFAVGATFVWYQVLIDNAYRVSANMSSSLWFGAYLVIVRSLFVVIGPWLFLRSEGMQQKVWELTASVCASVVINIVVSGMVRGDFTPIIWLAGIPYTIGIGLSLVLAYELCLRNSPA